MIVNFLELEHSQIQQIDQIFFQNSKKIFHSDLEREEFKNKWLRQYIENPKLFFVKLIDHHVAGYINGNFITGNLLDEFSPLLAKFPAHLHINVSENFQGKSLGKELLAYFFDQLIMSSILGVHIVTSPQSRNVKFYHENGFYFTQISSCQKFLFMGHELKVSR